MNDKTNLASRTEFPVLICLGCDVTHTDCEEIAYSREEDWGNCNPATADGRCANCGEDKLVLATVLVDKGQQP